MLSLLCFVLNNGIDSTHLNNKTMCKMKAQYDYLEAIKDSVRVTNAKWDEIEKLLNKRKK